MDLLLRYFILHNMYATIVHLYTLQNQIFFMNFWVMLLCLLIRILLIFLKKLV